VDSGSSLPNLQEPATVIHLSLVWARWNQLTPLYPVFLGYIVILNSVAANFMHKVNWCCVYLQVRAEYLMCPRYTRLNDSSFVCLILVSETYYFNNCVCLVSKGLKPVWVRTDDLQNFILASFVHWLLKFVGRRVYSSICFHLLICVISFAKWCNKFDASHVFFPLYCKKEFLYKTTDVKSI
jgi:hypothetical protein